MPSRRSSFPRPTAARCASRRRPAALSVVVSARPGTRASAATSPRPRSSASCAMPSTSCACAWICPPGKRAITNVVMMGMGEPLQNYAALLPALANDARRPRLRHLAASRHGVDVRRGADDRSVARRLSGRAGRFAARPGRCLARRARAAQPQVPAARTARRPATAISRRPRATSSPSSTACSMASTTHRPRPSSCWPSSATPGRAGAGLPCKFNLIPFNPFPASGLQRSPPERVGAFAAVLQRAGYVTTVRRTRGDDIAAACGQLAGEVRDRTHVERRMLRAPIRIHRQPAGDAKSRPAKHEVGA